MASRLGAAPEDLLGVMAFETGGEFAPDIKNKAGSGATGLIQFLPSTASQLGTTPEALSKMSPEQQLDIVEQYLTPFKGKLNSLKDTYMAVLSPKAVGAPESTVLFTEGSRAYELNAGLDVRQRGHITVGDVLSRVRRFLGGGVAEAATGTRNIDEEIDREIARVRRQQADGITDRYIQEKNGEIDMDYATALRQIRPTLQPAGAEALGLRTTAREAGGAEPAPMGGPERIGRDVLQVAGGVRDAFVSTMQGFNLVGDWMREQGIGPSGKLDITIPEIAKADTAEGDTIRSVSQFLTAFIPATAAVKAVGVTSSVASGLASGAIADFLAFDPKEPRVANMLQELAPAALKPIVDYLATKPSEGEAEGRFKRAVEGLGLGVMAEGLFRVGKALWSAKWLKEQVGQATGDGGATAVAAAEQAATATPQAARKVAGAAPKTTGAAAADAPLLRTVTDEEIAQAMSAPKGQAVAEGAAPLPGASALQATPTTIRLSDETATRLTRTTADLPPSLSIGATQREQAQQFRAMAASGATEALPTEGKYLHINFDHIQTGDDLRQTIGAIAEITRAETEVQRRGVQTTAETLSRAESSAFQEVDRILGLGPGSALNPEDATAVRQVWLASAERLQGLSQELAHGNLAVADEWLRQFVITANVHTKAMGVQAEAGRALRVFGIDLPSTDKQFLEQLSEAMAGATTPESQELLRSVGAAGASQNAMAMAQNIAGLTGPQQYTAASMMLQQLYTPQQIARLTQQQHMAAMVAALTSPQQLAQFMRDVERVPAADMFTELWYGALLSSPPTHVVNTLDGALRTVWSIPERYFATAMGHPRDMATNFQAANAYVYGLKQGLQEAWGYAADAFRTGVSTFGEAGKVPFPREASFTAKGMGLDEGSMLGGFVDLLGSVARFSGKGMMATDEFFKVINYRMQLHERSFRQATEEGLTGQALAQRIVALTNNPTPELKEMASAWANYQTLSQPLAQQGAAFENLGKFVATLQEGREEWLPMKIILPFIKTPFNIVRAGLERTPLLGNLSANVNRSLMAGGAEGALARSKMALGSMTLGLFSLLAMENAITGKAPADPGQRATWERLGIQPYSIYVPGLEKYISYNRLDMVGLPMGLAADFVQIARESSMDSLTTITGAMLGAVFNSVTSKTWLKGVADVIDAVTPGRFDSDKQSGTDFERYVQQLVGSIVPSGVALVARMVDPVQRDPRGMVDALLARVPGMSASMPPRLDLWGRSRLRPEPLGPDLISPFMSRDHTPDEVDNELYRLGVPIRMPASVISIARGGDMTEETVDLRALGKYNRYVELSAGLGEGQKPLKEAIRDLLHSQAFTSNVLSDGPRGGKSWMILDLIQKYQEQGKALLRQEDPDVEKLLERKAISRELSKTTEGQNILRGLDFQIGAPR